MKCGCLRGETMGRICVCVGGGWLENQYVWLGGCDCCLERMRKGAKEKWRNTAEDGQKGRSRRTSSEWWRWEKQMQPLFCSLVDPDGKRVKQTQGSAQLAGGTLRLFLQLCFFSRPSRRQLGLPQRRPAWHHRQGCWKAAKHGVLKETNT